MKKTIEETTRLLLQGTLTKDEADKILLDLHNVSGRSELLIDFITWKNKKDDNWLKIIDVKEADYFLKSIDFPALDHG